jgi:ABC-type amino acid transport system permease subunit
VGFIIFTSISQNAFRTLAFAYYTLIVRIYFLLTLLLSLFYIYIERIERIEKEKEKEKKEKGNSVKIN